MMVSVVGVEYNIVPQSQAYKVVIGPAGSRQEEGVSGLNHGRGKVEVAVDGGKGGAIVDMFRRIQGVLITAEKASGVALSASTGSHHTVPKYTPNVAVHNIPPKSHLQPCWTCRIFSDDEGLLEHGA